MERNKKSQESTLATAKGRLPNESTPTCVARSTSKYEPAGSFALPSTLRVGGLWRGKTRFGFSDRFQFGQAEDGQGQKSF